MNESNRRKEPEPEPAGDSAPPVSSHSVIAIIEEGNVLEEKGLLAEAMARYDAAVQAGPRYARAHLNRGNVLLAVAKLDEARRAYELAIACDPHHAGAHFNLGNLNARDCAYEPAIKNYQAAIALRPDFADAFVAMGNVLDGLGRTAEAIASYERALAINPGYAEVHLNLGLIASANRRHDEAVLCLRRAINIYPDYLAAHLALGRAFGDLGVLDEAEASLRRALSIEPGSAETLCNLANTLLLRDKCAEALQLILRALERAPTWTAKRLFATCVARTPPIADDSRIRTVLETALIEAWGTPHEFCSPALALIMANPAIARCISRANAAWPERLSKAVLFGPDGLASLAADSLLHALLQATPVISLEFERFLACARHALLENTTSEQTPDPSDVAAVEFYAALARQCFTNEYIFPLRDDERLQANAARRKLLSLLNGGAPIPPLLLLAVAAYFPLCSLPDPTRLLAAQGFRPIDEVLREQVREPLEEETLRGAIGSLTTVTSGVSDRVRDQYEQNPYPRWLRLPIQRQTQGFNEELRRRLPHASFTPMRDDSAPEVLVAGCGTGGHSIFVAHQFRGVRVLAIDLSLRSIGYAIRKTRELHVANIEYARADILKLADIGRAFDVVSSVGVLHHLADPFAGWRILLSLLRPGGFMDLGLYSAIARRDVAKVRDLIAARGYGSTPDDIRCFRHDQTLWDTSVELQRQSASPDFYSTSECRDLLFHAQEHRLTLNQIGSFLSACGVHFLGFELDGRILNRYRARFVEDPSGTDLRNWARFEADNPDTFAAMYRFWIQKPPSH